MEATKGYVEKSWRASVINGFMNTSLSGVGWSLELFPFVIRSRVQLAEHKSCSAKENCGVSAASQDRQIESMSHDSCTAVLTDSSSNRPCLIGTVLLSEQSRSRCNTGGKIAHRRCG